MPVSNSPSSSCPCQLMHSPRKGALHRSSSDVTHGCPACLVENTAVTRANEEEALDLL